MNSYSCNQSSEFDNIAINFAVKLTDIWLFKFLAFHDLIDLFFVQVIVLVQVDSDVAHILFFFLQERNASFLRLSQDFLDFRINHRESFLAHFVFLLGDVACILSEHSIALDSSIG